MLKRELSGRAVEFETVAEDQSEAQSRAVAEPAFALGRGPEIDQEQAEAKDQNCNFEKDQRGVHGVSVSATAAVWRPDCFGFAIMPRTFSALGLILSVNPLGKMP